MKCTINILADILLVTSTLLFGGQAAECDGTLAPGLGFHYDLYNKWDIADELCGIPATCHLSCDSAVVTPTVGAPSMLFRLHRSDPRSDFHHCVEAVNNIYDFCFPKGYTRGRWSFKSQFYRLDLSRFMEQMTATPTLDPPEAETMYTTELFTYTTDLVIYSSEKAPGMIKEVPHTITTAAAPFVTTYTYTTVLAPSISISVVKPVPVGAVTTTTSTTAAVSHVTLTTIAVNPDGDVTFTTVYLPLSTGPDSGLP